MNDIEQKIIDLDWQLLHRFITEKHYEQQLEVLTKQLEENDKE